MKKKSQEYCIRFCVRLYTRRSAKKFSQTAAVYRSFYGIGELRLGPASDEVCIERAAAACERGVEIAVIAALRRTLAGHCAVIDGGLGKDAL